MSTSNSPKIRLSRLQRFLLETACVRSGRVSRQAFDPFFGPQSRLSTTARVKMITQTMERVIMRGFMVGYGVRTAEKWYIKEVRLTPLGRRLARRLAGEQQRLPLEQTHVTRHKN